MQDEQEIQKENIPDSGEEKSEEEEIGEIL